MRRALQRALALRPFSSAAAAPVAAGAPPAAAPAAAAGTFEARLAALEATARVRGGALTSTKPHPLEAAIAAAPDAAAISRALQAAVVRGSVQPGPRTAKLLLRKLLGLPAAGRGGGARGGDAAAAAAAALPEERLRSALAVLLEPRFRLPVSGAAFALLLHAAPRAKGSALAGEVIAAARARGASRTGGFVLAAVRAAAGAGALGEAVRVVREGAAARSGGGGRAAALALQAALAGAQPGALAPEDEKWCAAKLPALCAPKAGQAPPPAPPAKEAQLA
jgi:hypothetical protein